MSKQRIENPTIGQVRIGDWVEGTYNGHMFDGEVWGIGDGMLLIGSMTIGYAGGAVAEGVGLDSLTRDVPDLPTKPGTVGRATVRGVPNVRIVLHKNGAWFSPSLDVDDYRGHYEHYIDASTFVLELEGDGDE